MAGYLAHRVAAALARHLPASAAYAVSAAVAYGYYLFDVRARRGICENLRAVRQWKGEAADEKTCRRLARETFRNYGRYIVDFFRLAEIDAGEWQSRVVIEGLDRLSSARARGRGVIVVSAHLGNWELGGALLHALGYPLWVAVAPQGPRLERFLSAQRERRGLRAVPMGSAARVLLRHLAAGDCVALLADRAFCRVSAKMPFFGRPAPLPRGPVRLAALSGAPLVPAFFVRLPDGRFRLRIGHPISPEGRTEEELAACLRDELQTAIAEFPTQWFVFHPFWLPEVITA